jgi:hypothetical protein
MKKLLILCALLATCQLAPATILTISNFSDLSAQAYSPFTGSWNNGTADQYTQGSGFVSITPVDLGNPQGDGNFNAIFAGSTSSPTSVNLTGLTDTLSLTAMLNTGNTDSLIKVTLRDASFNVLGTANFATSDFNSSSFSTESVSISLTGNISDATYWTLYGDGNADDNVRMSFDDLTLGVPEPSSIALFGSGIAGLCLFGYLRSRKMASVSNVS